MEFNKIDEETIGVSESGLIGYITINAVEGIEKRKEFFFDFAAGVNPSLTFDEMKEIVSYIGKMNEKYNFFNIE